MDRLRVGRRSVLGGVVAAVGSMAGCVWEEGDGGDEADSSTDSTPQFGYGGKPVVNDQVEDRQIDESDTEERERDDGDGSSGGGGGGFTLGPRSGSGDGGGEDDYESTLGVGEQGYGEQGYGGVKLEDESGENGDENATQTAA